MIESANNEKGVKYQEFVIENDYVKKIKDTLWPAYAELQTFRTKYKKKEAAYYNAYDHDFDQTSSTKAKGILRSHFVSTGTEIFSSGMAFPDFSIEARSRTNVENKNKEALAKALIEWGIRSSGFEDIYHKSKSRWIPYGDSYRRPFSKKKTNRFKRGNKNTRNLFARKGDKKYLQYEELDPTRVILDTSVKNVRSESDSESINFWAYCEIYSETALVRKFGAWILDFAKPGAMIDIDEYAILSANKDQKQTKYYEVIEYENRSDEVEAVLVGSNGFPVSLRVEQDEDLVSDGKFAKYVWWENTYPHYNSFGVADLTLHNAYMFWDSRSIRNLGLADKLYGAQVAHEIVENSKLDSTRRRMREIPVISGGRASSIESKVAEWEMKYESNIHSVLHLPTSVQNQVPQTSVIRFEGVSAADGTRSTDDIHNLARNTAGVSLTRLEVQHGIGVGQSEILEDEKIVSVERIVRNNMENLRLEFTGLLDYIVNNRGFGLDETITYTKYMEEQGATRMLSFQMKETEISIKNAAKMLESFEFDLHIDRNSIIEKRQIAMAEKIINFLGVIDPAALPEVSKLLMGRLAEIMRVDIPAESFEGVESSRALGGRSQFQSTNNPQQNAQPVQTDPQAALSGAIGGQGFLQDTDFQGA